ncbi:MAG: DsbC family protein [Nitrospiraceae bacterium]|nr:DsbC family protein [Nitrospiraceae bacterium]
MRKTRIIITLAVLLNLAVISYAFSAEIAGHECTKCHVLTKEEAKNALKNPFPDAKIIEVLASPIKGVWEVDFESNGKKGLIYLDYSKMLATPAIYDLKAGTNLTAERNYQLNKIDMSKIPLNKALVMGQKNAKNKIIVFTDPDCPFCGKLHQEIKKVIEKRKDIAFYLKLYPLVKIHPDSYKKSKTIICQKSIALLEDNFEGKSIPEKECNTSEVDDNIKLAEQYGITGTPAIILPDGGILPGYKDAETLIKIIDSKI